MRIAIDAMGGDHAPDAVVKGAVQAVEHFRDLSVTLVGDEAKIAPFLKENSRIGILHTTEVITGEEEPVRAVRHKPSASMVLAAKEVKEGRADACISAGNTGALMAAGIFIVGRIRGIERPALAPMLPTLDGKGFLLLDVGANADAKPSHLLQYAYMGSVYAEKVNKIEKPRVGLLNIGTEPKKGNELARKAYELLSEADLHFIGNVEARDLLAGAADVVVADGFTGNMVLKTMEGTAYALFQMLKDVLTGSVKTKIAAGFLKNDLLKLKSKMDYTEYGGAGLFGLKAPVVKAHGSSNDHAIFHAIRQAREMAERRVTETIEKMLVQERF